jgi:hypothetical protein
MTMLSISQSLGLVELGQNPHVEMRYGHSAIMIGF